MCSSNLNINRSAFTERGVEDYERRRYRGLDQRIVHAREVKLIKKYIEIIYAVDGGKPYGAPALDVPCGYGRFSSLLWRGGWAAFNCDLSLEMVRRAQVKTFRSGVVANAIKGLPFLSGLFDLVLSVRFFHHVHDPADRAAILREFRRVTEGWVIVSFYRATAFHRLQRRLRRLFNKSRTNIKMIEPGKFEEEAKAAGFEVFRVTPLFRGLHAYHLALLKGF